LDGVSAGDPGPNLKWVRGSEWHVGSSDPVAQCDRRTRGSERAFGAEEASGQMRLERSPFDGDVICTVLPQDARCRVDGGG
jgi:hypothetical protein